MSSVVETFAWMDQALCASPGIDPDMWFDSQNRQQAQQICGGCPVRDQCDQHGDTMDAYRGVFGGRSRKLKYPAARTSEFIERDHGTEQRYQQHHRDGSTPCTRCIIAHQFEEREREARKRVSA